MRALFTTSGSAGHLGPLVPFADAVRRAGGSVLVATRASSAAAVAAAGFEVRPYPDPPAAERNAAFAAARGLPPQEANLVALKVFAGMDARTALPELLETCTTWRPDVVVSESAEFAGPLAAAHLGIPHATVSITQLVVEHGVKDEIRAELDRLRDELQLAPPNGAGSAHFTLMPPILEHPELQGPAGIQRFREPDGPPPAPLPDWWGGSTDPLVYVSFGSIAPQRDEVFPRLYRAAILALATLPVRGLVTIGRDRSPADLGPLPANVHVERWVPQANVMPYAQAMVSHGGSGTLRAGLAAGLPQVVLPMFADQPDNAERVDALGAGIALAGADGLADAIRAVLTEPRYAARAAEVAAEIRALPLVDLAAVRLRELAAA